MKTKNEDELCEAVSVFYKHISSFFIYKNADLKFFL